MSVDLLTTSPVSPEAHMARDAAIAASLARMEQTVVRVELRTIAVEQMMHALVNALAEEDSSDSPADACQTLDGQPGGRERADGQEL